MHRNIKAHLALGAVNLLYGANYVIAKEVTPAYIKPFGFIILRVSVAMCLFWAVHKALSQKSDAVFLRKKIEKKDWALLAMCGLFGVAINQLMFFKGLSMTSPINASLIMITTPIIVIVIAAILIKERITWHKLLGIAIGLFGASAIIMGNNGNGANGSFWGDVFVAINASSYALYLVLVKPMMQRYHAITIIKWVFFFGFFIVVPFGWSEFQQIEWHTFDATIWLSVLYVLIGATFFTYLLNVYALQTLNASVVSTYIYTQPVIATTIAIALGKDSLSLEKVLAAMAIFVGVFLVSRNFEKKVVF